MCYEDASGILKNSIYVGEFSKQTSFQKATFTL